MPKSIKLVFMLFISMVAIEGIAWLAAIEFAKQNYPWYMNDEKIESPLKLRHVIPFADYYKNISGGVSKWSIRSPSGLQYKDSPIVIFGCSFAYGDGLANDNQTLPYKLSEKMMRPVYNRAYAYWGVQHMFYQLQKEPLLDTIKDPEYVIYVFINDHLRRLNMYGDILGFIKNGYSLEYLGYKEKEGNLVQKRDLFPFLRYSMTANIIAEWWNTSFRGNEEYANDRLDLLKLHLLESQKIVNKKWPDAKFVVINYDQGTFTINTPPPPEDFWKQIEKEGIYVINAQREFGVGSSNEKYKISDKDYHPNERAWDVIVPQLVKRLKEISSRKTSD